MADWNGVCLDYRLGAKGWYSYDSLPALLSGADISPFKQDQYQDRREHYLYRKPSERNPESLFREL